jgi:hypothetical protein
MRRNTNGSPFVRVDLSNLHGCDVQGGHDQVAETLEIGSKSAVSAVEPGTV